MRSWRMGGVLVMGILLAACGNTPVVQSAGNDPSQFVSKVRSYYSADYEPVDSPAELAKMSNLVVRGHLEDISIGPSVKTSAEATSERELLDSFVLKVRVAEVLVGRKTLLTDGYVYPEIPRGFVTEAELDATLPSSEVLLFLTDLSKSPPEFGFVDEHAGRPKNAVRLAPFAQGMIFSKGVDAPIGLEDLGEMSAEWSSLRNYGELLDSVPKASAP